MEYIVFSLKLQASLRLVHPFLTLAFIISYRDVLIGAGKKLKWLESKIVSGVQEVEDSQLGNKGSRPFSIN